MREVLNTKADIKPNDDDREQPYVIPIAYD